MRVNNQRDHDCNQRENQQIVEVVHESLLTQQRMHASVLLSWFKLQFQPRLCIEYSAMPSITAHAKAIKTKALPARVQIPTWASFGKGHEEQDEHD